MVFKIQGPWHSGGAFFIPNLSLLLLLCETDRRAEAALIARHARRLRAVHTKRRLRSLHTKGCCSALPTPGVSSQLHTSWRLLEDVLLLFFPRFYRNIQGMSNSIPSQRPGSVDDACGLTSVLCCLFLRVTSHHITSHRTTGCFKALFLISLNEAPTQYQSHCICSSLLFFLHTLFSFCCLGSWLLSQFPIAPVTCLSALLINLPVSLCFSLKRKKEAGNSSCSYHKVSHLSVLTV